MLARSWREIFESNAKIIYEEIDYRGEAKNGMRFAANFANDPNIKVPDVFEEHALPCPSLAFSDLLLSSTGARRV